MNLLNAIMKWSESHSVMFDFLQAHRLYSPWNSPGQNKGVGSLSLLQGIFPTQGSLLHCRWILYQLSHKGSPRTLEWVAYPFSRGSSRPQESNWGLLHCRWIFTNWALCSNKERTIKNQENQQLHKNGGYLSTEVFICTCANKPMKRFLTFLVISKSRITPYEILIYTK